MGPNGYSRLHDFISREMQMSHIYQPVMLRVLLENEGRASRSAIAKAFLAEDRSQIVSVSRLSRLTFREQLSWPQAACA